MTYTNSDRTFQVWLYKVSHGQLLIRSPKSEGQSTNLDLMFFGVRFIHLPMLFRGLEVADSSVEEVSRSTTIVEHYGLSSKAYGLFSGSGRYWVLADSVEVEENDLDIFSSRLDIRGHVGPEG